MVDPSPARKFLSLARPEVNSGQAKARPEREAEKVRVIISPISRGPRAANLPFSNQLRFRRGPSGQPCSDRHEVLALRNSRQRKTKCWPAGRDEADGDSERVCRQGIRWSVATV